MEKKEVRHWLQFFDWDIRLRMWLGLKLYGVRTTWWFGPIGDEISVVMSMARVRPIDSQTESLQFLAAQRFSLEELKVFRAKIDSVIEHVEIKRAWKSSKGEK